jgi:hypothetical protein
LPFSISPYPFRCIRVAVSMLRKMLLEVRNLKLSLQTTHL